MRRYYGLAVASGCVWAVIAYALSSWAVNSAITGGLLASPFIGLVVGRLLRPAYKFRKMWQVLLSLLALYVAAALFGLAVGLYDAFWLDIPNRTAAEVVLQAVVAYVWGLTFLLYFVALWPLAFLNHRLLGRYLSQPMKYS
jgi:hypothetical protein